MNNKLSQEGQYFSNHSRSHKFPWNLYHDSLEQNLEQFLNQVSKDHTQPAVLVVGCGLLVELPKLPSNISLSCTDIDQRVLERVKELNDPRISEVFLSSPDSISLSLLDSAKKFDAIYMKEVVEHILNPKEYLQSLLHLLNSGGKIWLSTPNYGEPWLPSIEYSILEVIARFSGFSRLNLHPSKFSKNSLITLLKQLGLSEVNCDIVSYRFAMVAKGTKV